MKTLTINQQKPGAPTWTDETGTKIPFNRTKKSERLNEKKLADIAKKAMDYSCKLLAFKKYVRDTIEELYLVFLTENNGKRGKGNVTLFNFDRSIKVELDVKEAIILDETFVELAKAELGDLLADGLEGAVDWIEPLVMDAFSTTGGRLDYKKVLGLRRHASRIPDERFKKAMEFIDKGIRRPSSKQYHRVYVKDSTGEYQAIKLNFSDLDTED